MKLFSTFKLREVTFRNRIFVSPMCMYSAKDGAANEWHMVHLGSRAVGGAGLVIAEATAVSPDGRISPGDSGMWDDEQARAFKPITDFIKQNGAAAGIQLAHAGRKASTLKPWNGGGPLSQKDGGWTPLAPSPLPFADGQLTPKEMTRNDVVKAITQFAEAANRCAEAGFQVIELHMAHGYLLHEFLSPLTNKRTDEYGGSFENRTRLPLKVAEAVRKAWPAQLPLFVRISDTDWVEGGWDLPQTVRFCRMLKEIGVDLIDCSSGGLIHGAKVPAAPGFHSPFSEKIRDEAKIATGVVGLITEPQQAEDIISQEKADAVFLARQMLRDPYWPLHAAKTLGVDVPWPKQYERAK